MTSKQTGLARITDNAKVSVFLWMWVCLTGWIMLLPGKHMACRGHLPQLKWHTPAHKLRHVSISSFHIDTRHINKTKQRQMVETGTPQVCVCMCVCVVCAIRRLPSEKSVFELVFAKEAYNGYYIVLVVFSVICVNGKFLTSVSCQYVCTHFFSSKKCRFKNNL